MQEEQDTCRICSAPAEPDQPLFHPCKCSGTIRYIHQDCLTEWLAHSKKKTCDVCKYPYSFTKVYSKDMPEKLPFFLVLRQFSQQLAFAVLFGLRAVLVAIIWLAALPWATIWTWRMYFAMGNHAAWWISALKRPEHEPDLFDEVVSNTTVTNATTTEQQSAASSGFLTHPRVLQVSSDIVAGQIIASMIVVAFVGIFLLREWITQNARPGVFEDGDLPIDADVLPPPPAEIAAPLPELPDPAAAPPFHPPMLEEEFRPRHDPRLDDWGPRARRKKPRTRGDPIESSTGEEAPEETQHSRHDERDISRRKKFKRRALYDDRYRRDSKDGGWLSVTEGEEGQKPRRRRRRKSDYASDSQHEAGPSQQREAEEGKQGQMPNRLGDPLPALSEFTFTLPVPSSSAPSDEPSSSMNGSRSSGPVGFGNPPARNPFSPRLLYPDSSTEEDERDPTPTSPPRGPSMMRDVGVGTESMGSSSDAEEPDSSRSLPISGPSNPRRPPLPSMTLPPSPAGPSASTSAINSRKHTPLASPSLATYRAPEDLDADQPGNNYFGPEREWFGDLTDEEFEEAQARYFRKQHERRRDIMADRQAEVEREREEMEEMADGELDVEPDDEGDDIRWTDEDIVVEDEDEEDQPGQEDQAGRLGMEVNPAPGAGLAEGFNPPPPPADDLENDINIEDDMDGALEAIGLRGPVYGVLQNAILMTFILDTTIGLGIWLPFTIGKTTALLTLNPRRAMQILHLPLRMIRLITDPVVDTVLLLFARLIVPPLLNLVQLVVASCFNGVASLAGADRAEKLATIANSTYGHAMKLASQFMVGNATDSTPLSSNNTQTAPSYLYRLLEEDTAIMRVIEPYFAPLGHNVRQWSTTGKETWMELATGDDRQDRIFAVLLGYAVVGVLLAIYLNVLTVGTMRSAGRAVRSAIRQQLLVVKVAAFIIIELVIFPLGCGIMLDVCSVWMFPAGTFRSRAAFLLYAPLRAIFYHWVLGTMFMYQFAVLLSGCRGIMRPGAMWFIKDPQDQNFHPIRDILERPTLVQLRKLLLSAAMYGIVVASGVATISSILRLFRGTIMPFRWKIREPLSEVPIDLIFIQLVLPYTMEYFRPRKALRRLGTFVWKYFARQLRLSSYMFGGRYPSEEYTPTTWTWRFLLSSEDDVQMDDAEATHDGLFRRVPNSDNVALVKDAPATVDVDEEGYPLNEEGKKLIQAQNAEAERAKRSVKDDYTVVYIPPDFGYRVFAFLTLIWTVGSVLLATALAAPILLGRAFFRLFLPYDVHDGYSFIIGFYLLWGCYLVGAALDRMDKRRQRRWSDGPRAEWPLFVAKRSLLWVAQASYMAVTLGIIIPTLLGLTVELYLLQPFKHTLYPSAEPRIRMVDMWALGLLYAKIIIRSMQTHHPGHERMRGIDRLIRNGWTHLDPMRATVEVIFPVGMGLFSMIVLPAACLRLLTKLVTLPVDAHFLFLHVYPMIFTLAGLGHAAWMMSKVMASWSQTIRDKEFLVEMRLRNLEEQDQEAAKEQEGQAQ